MATGEGWTSSVHDVNRIHLLDWVAGNGDVLAERYVASEPFFTVDEDTAQAMISTLVTDGLLRRGNRLASGYELSSHGSSEVTQRRERRSDVVRRRAALRDAFLDFLAQQEGKPGNGMQELMASPHSFYEGEHATQHEIHAAQAYLLEAGYATVSAGWGDLATLTPAGWEVVEDFSGSIAAYRGRHRSAGTTNITHFTGPVSGMVAIGDTAHQIQHQSAATDELVRLLHEARDAARELPPAEQAFAGTYIDLIQAEAASEDDKLRTGAAQRLLELAKKAGSTAFTAAVTAVTQQLLT